MNSNSEGSALLAAVNENLNDLAPRLIYSDWLEENGRHQEALWWRGKAVKSHKIIDFYWDMDEDGNSYGDGFGYSTIDVYGGGDGAGFYFRQGIGDGYDFGGGKGSGGSYEHGFGQGFRTGYGQDSEYEEIQKRSSWEQKHREIIEGKPVIGRQMLIWCGDGFAWIGHVDKCMLQGVTSSAMPVCSAEQVLIHGWPWHPVQLVTTTFTGMHRMELSIPDLTCMVPSNGRESCRDEI